MSVNRRNDGERQNGPMLVFEEMSPASLLSPSLRINAKRSPAVNVAPIQSAWWPFLKGSPPKFCHCHGVTQVSSSVIISFPLAFKCLKSDLTKAKIVIANFFQDNVLFYFIFLKKNQPATFCCWFVYANRLWKKWMDFNFWQHSLICHHLSHFSSKVCSENYAFDLVGSFLVFCITEWIVVIKQVCSSHILDNKQPERQLAANFLMSE